jgi:hypothetical protein
MSRASMPFMVGVGDEVTRLKYLLPNRKHGKERRVLHGRNNESPYVVSYPFVETRRDSK